MFYLPSDRSWSQIDKNKYAVTQLFLCFLRSYTYLANNCLQTIEFNCFTRQYFNVNILQITINMYFSYFYITTISNTLIQLPFFIDTEHSK